MKQRVLQKGDFYMLILEKTEDGVFCNGRKLTINAQASKGEGKEVVKIEGLEGSNGQKWVSLSKLKDGINEIECQARETNSKHYVLTTEEAAQVAELQAQIDAIIEVAKSRYVPRSKKLEDMTIEELEAYIAVRKG